MDSGLCMGLATTAISGEGVTLQPCGVSSKTVWVVDYLDSIQTTILGGYVPLINGSNTNFSQPFVLTYPINAYPTDRPRPQLTVTNITGFSQSSPPFYIPGPELGTVTANQLWSQTGSSARQPELGPENGTVTSALREGGRRHHRPSHATI